jgi:hypothetical protein
MVFLTYSRYQDKCFKLSFNLYMYNNQHNTLIHYFILRFCITCYSLFRTAIVRNRIATPTDHVCMKLYDP